MSVGQASEPTGHDVVRQKLIKLNGDRHSAASGSQPAANGRQTAANGGEPAASGSRSATSGRPPATGGRQSAASSRNLHAILYITK